MEVVVLQVFVSLILVLGSLLLFAHSVKERNHEHASRLSLLPLESDDEVRDSGTKRALGGRQE
ncbi:MAG: cytochrome oxidase [Polyangiaceae bacterium]|nr:cytochrome oxidase [Polyangiaceae bacterium]